MSKVRVAVTGGSGKAGKWILRELLDHGYDVINLDVKYPAEELCRTIITDLNDLGQVTNALSPYATGARRPVEAVIHFAAIPRAYDTPNEVTFRNNTMSTYNILEACANLGIRKVVLASSESSYGICFAHQMFSPKYLPVDEEHPQLPEDSYGLSKVVNELTAETFHRRTGMQVVSFRLGNILEPEDYSRVIESFGNPEKRLRNLWSYIDSRDVAAACRMAIEKEGLGAVPLILAADDTSSDRTTEALVSEFFPELKEFKTRLSGRMALLSSEKAKVLLGWRQQFYLQGDAEY